MKLIHCSDCKALLPDTDSPTHEYLGGSAGCWKLYGEILAKEYGDPEYMKIHRLTVDTYAVQHPGKLEPRATQSVNIHLLALYLVLEKECDFKFATQIMGKIIERKKGQFLWLEPPSSLGDITVIDVAKAQTPKEHSRIVRKWAVSTWKAWQPHHFRIIELAKEFL